MIWLICSPVTACHPGAAQNSPRMTLVTCAWPQSQGRNRPDFPCPPSDSVPVERARSVAQHGQQVEQYEPSNRIGVCLIVTSAVPHVWQSAGLGAPSSNPLVSGGVRRSRAGNAAPSSSPVPSIGSVRRVRRVGLRHFPLDKGGRRVARHPSARPFAMAYRFSGDSARLPGRALLLK